MFSQGNLTNDMALKLPKLEPSMFCFTTSFETPYINIIACHKITLDIFVSLLIRNFTSRWVNVAETDKNLCSWQSTFYYVYNSHIIHAASCQISEVVN